MQANPDKQNSAAQQIKEPKQNVPAEVRLCLDPRGLKDPGPPGPLFTNQPYFSLHQIPHNKPTETSVTFSSTSFHRVECLRYFFPPDGFPCNEIFFNWISDTILWQSAARTQLQLFGRFLIHLTHTHRGAASRVGGLRPHPGCVCGLGVEEPTLDGEQTLPSSLGDKWSSAVRKGNNVMIFRMNL